ncbi:hypothetical protein PHET_12199 [Paragonimus heterotremus]|uniref:Uncharacterized protein n=1 Tax=Paragonimus heterotremus TaxID=100268 RepID=A0A8J4WCB4_9TREM|nr:hypothetical protein PHET_12199 [Paragonimus heterotremus]
MLEEDETVGDVVAVDLPPEKADLHLVLACEDGNLRNVKTLTDDGADICYQGIVHIFIYSLHHFSLYRMDFTCLN